MAKILLSITLFLPLSTLAQSANVNLPERGALKSSVEAAYGQANRQLGPVGNPPITQWVYDQFTVVFEYDHVVHAYARDMTLEGRPQSAIPARPSSLTLPESGSESDEPDSEIINPTEPEPMLIDDREEPITDSETEADFEAFFDSEEDTTSSDFSENTP